LRLSTALFLLLPIVATGQPGGQAPPAPASEVVLVSGPRAIALTDYYTISFRLRGTALQQYSEFPELEGFRKSGKTSTTTTRLVQGKASTELTITQRYAPYGEGEFVVKPFQMTVNGLLVRSAGTRVRIKAAAVATTKPATPPPAAAPAPGAAAPSLQTPTTPAPVAPAPLTGIGSLDQLLGKPKPALYTEPADHAFLAIVADRPRVFVGEGVRVGLYFYLTVPDQALLAFHDYNSQLPALLRQLRQPTTWEVPAVDATAAVTPDSVRRGTQLYLRYRLAESTYYPLTTAPLEFPSLALTMTKFRLLKKPEPGADNRLGAFKIYVARGLRIAVYPLPARPATIATSAEVAVGDYQLREALSTSRPHTGKPFIYLFSIEGAGNLSAMMAPPLMPRPGLDVYGPEVHEQQLPGGAGRKTFRYRLVARRPGELPLDSLLQLVTFNPRTGQYASLRPQLHPTVLGPETQQTPPERPADDPFYGPALAGADAALQPLDVYAQVRRIASYLVLGLLGVAAIGWWRARKV
jgi:hypothetical protein